MDKNGSFEDLSKETIQEFWPAIKKFIYNCLDDNTGMIVETEGKKFLIYLKDSTIYLSREYENSVFEDGDIVENSKLTNLDEDEDIDDLLGSRYN